MITPAAAGPAGLPAGHWAGHIAAIDQGTTSSRCIVFDAAGRPVAMARREHRQVFPAPGRVEHDAAETACRSPGPSATSRPRCDALAEHWSADAEFTPKLDAEQREREHRMWLKAVERTLGWAD